MHWHKAQVRQSMSNLIIWQLDLKQDKHKFPLNISVTTNIPLYDQNFQIFQMSMVSNITRCLEHQQRVYTILDYEDQLIG